MFLVELLGLHPASLTRCDTIVKSGDLNERTVFRSRVAHVWRHI